MRTERRFGGEARRSAEGEVFRIRGWTTTYRLIAERRRAGLTTRARSPRKIEAYLKRFGGWLTKAELGRQPHEWSRAKVNRLPRTDVWGLPPTAQGLVTMQPVNIGRGRHSPACGFQSARPLTHEGRQSGWPSRTRQVLRRPPPSTKQPPTGLLSRLRQGTGQS